MDAIPDGGFVDILTWRGDVGGFGDVEVSADAKVAVGAFHELHFGMCDELELFACGVHAECSFDFVGFEEDQRAAAGLGGDADELLCELVRDVDGFDEYVFAGLEAAGIVDERVGEFGVTRV